MELAKWFRETKVDKVTEQQQIVLLQDTATVDLALRTLAKHRILSAPMVINNNGDPTEARISQAGITPEQITGFCDIRDILSSFLKEFDVKEVSAMKMLQRMRLLEDRGSQFCKKELQHLPVLNSDGKFSSQMSNSLSLLDLVQDVFLADSGSQGIVHRVAMFDREGGIVKIISQTDIIKLLVNNKAMLGDIANKTLQELGLAEKPVISVPPEISAFETLAVIQDQGISAVAIVSAEGKIIGNFSVSELRTILAEHFGSLSLPVGEFLALEHGTEYSGYGIYNTNELQDSHGHQFAKAVDQRQHPGQEVGQNLIVCSKDETLLQAMELIATNMIHRVYVVSEDKKPTSVVTMSDILTVINQYVSQ